MKGFVFFGLKLGQDCTNILVLYRVWKYADCFANLFRLCVNFGAMKSETNI